MTINPALLTLDASNPPPWVLYALCTLNRLAYYQSDVLAAAWAEWAGGNQIKLFSSNSLDTSTAVGVSDGANAIVAYEGTRNVQQLILQVVASAQVTFPASPSRAAAFHLWSAIQRNQDVEAWYTGILPTMPVTLVGHSMGGSIAHITAVGNISGSTHPVPSLVTFGEPRPGNPAFGTLTTCPYVRVVNTGDLVPNIPPPGAVNAAILALLADSSGLWNYAHTQAGWLIGNGTLTPLAPDNIDPLSGAAVNSSNGSGLEFDTSLVKQHPLSVYASALLALAQGDPASPPLNSLIALNGAMDNADATGSAPVWDSPAVQSAGVFADPNVVINTIPGPAVVPLTDIGSVVELNTGGLRLGAAPGSDPIFSTPLLIGGSAMNFWKCTFFFECNNYGWTETYYLSSAAGSPVVVFNSANGPQQLAQALIGLRGINTQLFAVRISLVAVPINLTTTRSAQVFFFQPALRNTTPAFVANSATTADPNVAMLCRFIPVLGGPAKALYLRGFPDAFEVTGGLPVASVQSFFGGNWFNFVSAFTGAVRNQPVGPGTNWGFHQKVGQIRCPISGIVQTAGGQVLISTSGVAPNPPGFITPALLNNGPITVPLRISGLQQPGNLNGVHPFTVQAANAAAVPPIIGNLNATSERKIAILTPTIGNGFATYAIYGIATVASVIFERIGERKAGRPSYLQRGRAPNRKTA